MRLCRVRLRDRYTRRGRTIFAERMEAMKAAQAMKSKIKWTESGPAQ